MQKVARRLRTSARGGLGGRISSKMRCLKTGKVVGRPRGKPPRDYTLAVLPGHIFPIVWTSVCQDAECATNSRGDLDSVSFLARREEAGGTAGECACSVCSRPDR